MAIAFPSFIRILLREIVVFFKLGINLDAISNFLVYSPGWNWKPCKYCRTPRVRYGVLSMKSSVMKFLNNNRSHT